MPAILTEQRTLVEALEHSGEFECVVGDIVTSTAQAVTESRRLAAARVDATVYNFVVWTFPQFAIAASQFVDGQLILLSNVDPQFSGLVGLLAVGGGLDAVGRPHQRVTGSVSDPDVRDNLLSQLRAGAAVARLRGQTFGVFGGRSMGMYTATPDPVAWQRDFGIDIEHIDQWEIVRRSASIDADRVRSGRNWLERHCRTVAYDGATLTPDKLELQVRSYHAIRELVDEWGLDFCGIKGQPEMTTSYATMDIAEAFLNDPYDWEGPHEPIVCATEADADGALTMQILKHLTGTPVLFADVRYYDSQRDMWDLANSGQHATYFAGAGDDPEINLSRVDLLPEVFFFPAGGASVHHIAAPGEVTLARLGRHPGGYRMVISRGEFLSFGPQEDQQLAQRTTREWAHAYTRVPAAMEDVVSVFPANHIHAVYGDHVTALTSACRLLGIEPVALTATSQEDVA
jgi:L-fucose isomerase